MRFPATSWPFSKSIEEIPGDAQMEDGAIEGIVRREERHAVEVLAQHVGHHHEESGMLQMQVGIDVDEGEVAQLYAAVIVLLHGILVELWQEVGGVVLGEPCP